MHATTIFASFERVAYHVYRLERCTLLAIYKSAVSTRLLTSFGRPF